MIWKALIMAASILIGILILSLAVYLFVSFGSTSRDVHKQIDTQRIEQFNSQFTSYEGKEDITIHDVITVANLATETNIYYELKKSDAGQGSNYITVILSNDSYPNKQIQGSYEDNLETLRNMYNNIILNEPMKIQTIDAMETKVLPKYTCKIDISPITKRVYKVTFIKK